MKKFLIIVLSALMFIAFYACTHKSYYPDTTTTVDTTHHTTDTTALVVTDTSVCFQRDVLPIFQSSCAISGCHNSTTRADNYVLDTYAGIIAKGLTKFHSSSSKLYTTCVSGKMPRSPTPKLDSAQLSYIRRWIDMGAPNDTNCIVLCDTTKFTYATGIAPILKTYCYSCHSTSSASSQGGGTILDTYTGVQTVVTNGKLMGDIQHSSGYNAMPLGGNQLDACKITQVRKWIAAGAQNN